MRIHQLINRLRQNAEFVRAWQHLEPNAQLAADIIGYRIRHRLSLSALAERCGLSRPTLDALENSVGNPQFDTLKAIAKAMGCKLQVRFIPEDEHAFPVRLVFLDWRNHRNGSLYGTPEYIDLSQGDFHSGSMFPATIMLDADDVCELQQAMADGYMPAFYAVPASISGPVEEGGDDEEAE